jgi:hypothetical protein
MKGGKNGSGSYPFVDLSFSIAIDEELRVQNWRSFVSKIKCFPVSLTLVSWGHID